MAKLEQLVIHCSDTPPGRDVTAKDIENWHMSPKSKGGRGWDRVGYSDLITLAGEIINLTPYNDDDEVQVHEITWGASGVNSISRHVCVVGGMCDKGIDWLTEAQFTSLNLYIREFIYEHPDTKITGHYHFSSKACPNFDVADFCRLVGIPEKYIYEASK